MLALKKKIKGSTIIEVIIALMIGMIIIGMSMSIVVKTGRNYNASQRARAVIWMNNRFIQLKDSPEVREDSIVLLGMIVYENVSKYENQEDVLMVDLKAVSREMRFLANKRSLIFIKLKDGEKK